MGTDLDFSLSTRQLTGILYPTTHTPIGKYKQDLDRWFASNAASQVSRKQTFAALLLGDSAVASAEPALDLSRLAACCAHVPGLAPVVDTLPRVRLQYLHWYPHSYRKVCYHPSYDFTRFTLLWNGYHGKSKRVCSSASKSGKDLH